MLLGFMIISALLASAIITGFIKDRAYNNISDKSIDEENIRTDIFLTALGVVIISNLIPFLFGAAIGLYAIL